MYRRLNAQESDMISYKRELTEKPQLLVLDWTNKYFEIGKQYCEEKSSDPVFKLASIIVKDNEVIWKWSNISKFHEEHWCNRKDVHWNSLYKSGEWYEKCPWCNPKTSHSEPDAINDCMKKGDWDKLKDSTLFLYWHFWPCPSCWDFCKKHWIKNIIVQSSAFQLHNGR